MPRRKRDEPLSIANTHLIDTNVVLRYLLNDDPDLSARALALIERVEQGKEVVEVTEIVLMEVVWTLTTYYQDETSNKLTAFISLPGVRAPSRRICVRALRDFADSAVDFVDCLLAARSRVRGVPVYTFDETDFKKLACEWKCP